MGAVADELAIVKRFERNNLNHAPAQLFLHTGFERFGRPGIGSWVSYGLGTENRDLPSYVVLITGSVAGAGNSLWGSGFLPTLHQGVEFRSKGDPVLFLSNPKGIDLRQSLTLLMGLIFNKPALADVGDPEIATRIAQYELAYRMQSSVPELMEIKNERAATLEAAGAGCQATSPRTTVCWLGDWWKRACGLFNCSIRAGIIIADCLAASPTRPGNWINRWRP